MKLRLAAIAVALLFSVGTASAATIQTFSSGTVNVAIADNSTITDTLTLPGIANPDSLLDLTVALTIDHSWVGDLQITLTAPDTTSISILLDQPGVPDSAFGYSTDLSATYTIRFNDAFTQLAETMGDASCTAGVVGGTGCTDTDFKPDSPLSALYGNFAGDWTLDITDNASSDDGTLVSWSLTAEFEADGAVVPEPSAAIVFGLGFALMAGRTRQQRTR